MSEATPPIEELIEPQDGGVALFPDLDWRWQDVVIGVLPIVVGRCSISLMDLETLRSVSGPLNIALVGWMWLYPVTIAYVRRAGFRWPDVKTFATEAALALPVLFTIWMGLAIVAGITLQLFPEFDRNTNPFVEPVAGSLWNPLLWVFFFAAVVLAPVGEELFFRGMVFQTLKQYVDIRSAILLQGILFGFIHTYGALHSVLASFLGIGFAITYQWRKTIVAPICLHVLQNSAAMVATVVMAQTIANGPFFGVWGEADSKGCKIIRVQPLSGADAADIRVDDVISTVDGQTILDFDDLKTAIRAHQIGDRVAVQFFRGSELHTVEVVLKQRTESAND